MYNRRYHNTIITKRTNYSIRWSIIPLPPHVVVIPFYFSWFVDSPLMCANHLHRLPRPPHPQQHHHRRVPRSLLLLRPRSPMIHIPKIKASRNAHCLNWARWNGWVKKLRHNINITYNPRLRWKKQQQRWCQRRPHQRQHQRHQQRYSSNDHRSSQ